MFGIWGEATDKFSLLGEARPRRLPGSNLRCLISPWESRNATLKEENRNNSGTCAREPRSPEAPLGPSSSAHVVFRARTQTRNFPPGPLRTMEQGGGGGGGVWGGTVGPVSLVKEPLGIFCGARRRADKTLSRSKSASLTCAAPYQGRFKGPQSRCFSREWLYGLELCFQTPWLIISQALEMLALYWQLAQGEVGGLLSDLGACKHARLFGDSRT